MTHTYLVKGMTCEGCLQEVHSALSAVPDIAKVEVDLETNEVVLEMHHHVSTVKLQAALLQTGNKYHIRESTNHTPVFNDALMDLPEPSVTTYKPLILIVAFIIGTTLLSQWPFDTISFMEWMRNFMAGFFIVFAFFKLLNLNGFASSYSMYDIIAAKWNGWGYMYPFLELALGVSYLINFNPAFTNWATIIILGISSIGVIESNLNKRKIKCACLGDVFNLPMSTVTIVEDLSMVGMAAFMLIY
jgi:cation transport ATPase